MEALFWKLAQMSLSAGWLVLIVAVLRLALRKAPRWMLCLLWVLVAARLVCPVRPVSRVSLMPEPVQLTETMQAAVPAAPHSSAQADDAAEPEAFSLSDMLSRVWIVGVGAMLLWAAHSSLKLRRRLLCSVEQAGGYRICDEIDTPFVFGILRPKIYLPSSMEAAQIPSVLAHERAHIARRDHWWKPLGFLLLAVYWFHPLLWLGYVLFCRDLELACDERVIRRMDHAQRAAYSQALLNCSHTSAALAFPVAFGEVGVKARVQTVLRYKKPALWLAALALMLVCAAAVFFLPDRPGDAFAAYFDRYIRTVETGKAEEAAAMRYFPTDTQRQMYLDHFIAPTRIEVTEQTAVNDNLAVFTCVIREGDLPAETVYQFVGRDGGALRIYANVQQIPDALKTGLDESLYDYHADERVMFAEEDAQIQTLMEADAKALIEAFPTTDGADAELVLARLAEYYRADPDGVTAMIEQNTLTEQDKATLLRGLQLELEPADTVVTVGAAQTVDCVVDAVGRARAPMLFQPAGERLTVTLRERPVPPVVVRLYASPYGEVTQFGEVQSPGDQFAFTHLSSDEAYLIEVVLPEGTPEGSTVTLQISE